MKISLREILTICKTSTENFLENEKKREDWILENPAQIALLTT